MGTMWQSGQFHPIGSNKQSLSKILFDTKVYMNQSGDVSLEPNKYYIFDEVSDLNITLPNQTDTYQFQFISGDPPTQLTLPTDIKWLEDDELVPETNRAYQVSIYNGIASYGGYSL